MDVGKMKSHTGLFTHTLKPEIKQFGCDIWAVEIPNPPDVIEVIVLVILAIRLFL